MLVLQMLAVVTPTSGTEPSKENRILAVVEKMKATLKEVEDYTCEIQQIFYKDGVENERYRSKFYFKRKKKIRVDFLQPYPGLTLFYNEGAEKVTVKPFRFIPWVKLRFSIDNPTVQTPTGQRIDQTDMDYFIDFLFRNLETVQQREDEFQEEGDRITFLFWALDYIGGKAPEKYRITLSKGDWFPTRIERYTLEGKPIEVSIIQNYRINTHLEDKLFIP